MSTLLRGISIANITNATTIGKALLAVATPGNNVIIVAKSDGTLTIQNATVNATQTPVTSITAQNGVITAMS